MEAALLSVKCPRSLYQAECKFSVRVTRAHQPAASAWLPFRSIHRLIQSLVPKITFSFYRQQPIRADFSGSQITGDAGLLPHCPHHAHPAESGAALAVRIPERKDQAARDAGFALPLLYEFCEFFGIQYALGILANCVFQRRSQPRQKQVRVSTPVAGSATVLRDNFPSCSGGRVTFIPTLSGPSRWDNVMGKLNDLAWPPGRPEQRKYRRFSVSYPVNVKFHFEDSVSELQAVTKDVSVGGLLIETASPIPQHCPVDFIMTLHGGPVIRPVQVVGEGDVVRVEPHGPGAGFAIAIKCKRELGS